MSSSVPRQLVAGHGSGHTRAAGTPVGKFHPPGAPVSSARYTGGRRGTTPRSASKTAGIAGAVPKPKLTAEQQLAIIEKIESGNYRKGEGFKQFYDEVNTENNSKPKCRLNLYSSFAFVDPLAASTRNYGNGFAGSTDSLSMTSSIVSSVPSSVADGEVTSIGVQNDGEIKGYDDEGDFELPDYLKAFDRLHSTKECYFRSLRQLAELQTKMEFANHIPPQKMFKFLQSVEKVQKIIQKFLDGNASQNMQLFLPATSSKGPPQPFIHCDVENHASTIKSIYRLSEILDGFSKFLLQNEKDFKLEARLDRFKEMVNRVEGAIKTQEMLVTQVKDLLAKSSVLNQDSASSVIGIEILEDASP